MSGGVRPSRAHDFLAHSMRACSVVTMLIRRMQAGLARRTLAGKAKRAWVLYAKARRKALKYPAPHGYGDGYYECPCKRCDRAIRYDAAVEEAFKAWQNVKRCSLYGSVACLTMSFSLI